jgi:hypothetical protein
MFVYFWKKHTATVSGETTRREQCEGCGTQFKYTVKRTVSDSAHDPYMLVSEDARRTAKNRARERLKRKLATAVEPVHCPRCGIYQTSMVKFLRRQLGSRYDPNKYARDRITVTDWDAWQAASSANTVSAYTKFLETWPVYRKAAQDRIWPLKHPLLTKLALRPDVLKVLGVLALIFGVGILFSVRW